MIHSEPFRSYLRSGAFLRPLGLPEGTELSFSLLGQGEYNLNYLFSHPVTGRKLVLRINTGSQMHLERQIAYEFAALRDLESTGRTPRPLFYDDARREIPCGVLVMEWLPGRPLRYESDLDEAAAILADIHAAPVPPESALLRPEHPAQAIYAECLEMAAHYFTWDGADPAVCRLLETLAEEVGRLPLDAPSGAPRCMVNTELNSNNFLINPGARSYLVDWEKPLLSEPAQDLGHFLAPTTTFWKTDVILTPGDIRAFLARYAAHCAWRLDLTDLAQRLPLFFTVTCLRGVTWCAMALREYTQPGRPLTNAGTLAKLRAYLDPDFLTLLLERYVRRDFLAEGGR